jgi:HSP20 family molecular chaperone IbpA
MSRVQVTRTHETDPALPAFTELSRLMREVERRAFSRFQGRGRRAGSSQEDWTAAEHEVLGWPAAELCEVDGRYEMALTLPGYTAGEVEVTAAPREVVVHASTAGRRERGARAREEDGGTPANGQKGVGHNGEGHKGEGHKGEGHPRVLWSEFRSNDVWRRFTLVDPIDVDQVTARLENGMLRVRAPRAG